MIIPQFRIWITRSPPGIEFFYCNYCICSYEAGKTEVERDLKTKKHTDNAAGYGEKQIFFLIQAFRRRLILNKNANEMR